MITTRFIKTRKDYIQILVQTQYLLVMTKVFFPGIGFDMALDEYYGGVPVMVYKVE